MPKPDDPEAPDPETAGPPIAAVAVEVGETVGEVV
jgi:hypothetical protein